MSYLREFSNHYFYQRFFFLSFYHVQNGDARMRATADTTTMGCKARFLHVPHSIYYVEVFDHGIRQRLWMRKLIIPLLNNRCSNFWGLIYNYSRRVIWISVLFRVFDHRCLLISMWIGKTLTLLYVSYNTVLLYTFFFDFIIVERRNQFFFSIRICEIQ